MTKIDQLLESLNKDHKRIVAQNGVYVEDPPRLPSGIFPLDLAIGGGLPEGRINYVYGNEASMKTTMCMKWMASAQRKYPKKKCVFVDIEGTFDKKWAKRMGMDVDSLVYSRPAHAEQAVDVIHALMYADDVSVMCVDSLAAMITNKELDSDAEDSMMGVNGILINKLYRKVSRGLAMNYEDGRLVTPIFLNQVRAKMGVTHGDPETTPGGKAFHFGSSMTLRFYGKDVVDKDVDESSPAFKHVSVIVKKSKVPIVARSSEFDMALIPQVGLKVGSAPDYKTIFHYLKTLEFLSKPAKLWQVADDAGKLMMEAKTQDEIDVRLRKDREFSDQIRQCIIRKRLAQLEAEVE